ncbi:DUF2974 domain-containing protein [Blautia sp. MSJ-19]|uniref:DUF2974 domain-containing protein n=1 Tax=Blautia sp. MSJ-19 TaxID=2841517 RepID=UPI001C0E9CCD|nr:DUF2974 domain-containing protein [Blautia sp. MSJ-19]MBU5480819.1 DUF2974 domain-containing protein [Blautia sp. MSJ-19]
MGNIMDYLSWRGDLSFEQSAFNEVDNLILACLSYVNLDGISGVADSRGMELKKLVKEFQKLHTLEELEADKSFIRLAPFMMIKMAETNRFGNCVVRNYINEIITEQEQQFAALEVVLEDGTSYVSFRGTDDTIIGWKEDFNLSTGVVPAQKRAVEYLHRVAENAQGMLRVGGHSKGGNLAIYGAVMCKEAHDRILEIYSNDGPGFSKEFQELPETEKMMPKIIRIIPEYSIIGTLLEHEKEPIIVASSSKGLLQHDGFSWEVEGPTLVSRDSLNKTALRFIEILHKWIDGMDMEQKKVLIEDLFATLQASGYENLSEVQSGGLKSLAAMVKRVEKFAPESRGMMQELLVAICGGWLEQLQMDTKDKLSVLPLSFSDKILEKF